MSTREINIAGTVALVTGANRGIGRALTEALLERGAGKVYATARDPQTLSGLVHQHGDRVVPLRLDVTEPEQIDAMIAAANDVELLFNNAGVALVADLSEDSAEEQARQEMEVNYFGPLRLIRRAAPTLAANGGGAVVNIASVVGLTNFPFFPTYSASKAAIHSLTQALRLLLAEQGTDVFGVYPGPVDTDMARDLEMDKTSPEEVARAVLDGLEAGQTDIFPDDFARDFGQRFHSSPKASERQVAEMLAEAAA